MEQNSSKTLVLAVVGVVVLVVGAWLLMGSRQATAPEISGPTLSEEDTTAAIEAELNATDFGDLEAELQATDADLNSL